jgi:hypothetical protein
MAITGGYWVKQLTTNLLGRGGYFYNRQLVVIVFITNGFKTTFQFGFWASFCANFNFFKNTFIIFGHFAFWFKIDKSKYRSKIYIKKKIQIQIQIQNQNITNPNNQNQIQNQM